MTGVRFSGEIAHDGEVSTMDGVALPTLFVRYVELNPNAHALGIHGGKTCIWRVGAILFSSARIRHEAVPQFVEWLGACECPELIDG